jgi:hypothetical protein
MTMTNVKYGKALDAELTGPQKCLRPFPPRPITIPEATAIVLAEEQQEDKLGTSCIPSDIQPLLATLLGAGSDEAPSVFQYIASRRRQYIASRCDHYLRKIVLWTPNVANRYTERAVIFGTDLSSMFNLDLGGDVTGCRPAFGVRLAQIPGGGTP